jgi:hypothetical protein
MWKYALIGGIASVVLTLGFYWQSMVNNSYSTLPVLAGGIVAGFLARAASIEANSGSVGLRAGYIGALPGLWLLGDFIEALVVTPNPTVVRFAFGTMIMCSITTVVVLLAAINGILGGKVGGWVATKLAVSGRPSSEIDE